jgi:hypothetical protein
MPELQSTPNGGGSGVQTMAWAARLGILVVVGLVVVALVFERTLTWFMVPALLVGAVVALVLRSSKLPDSGGDQARPEIQIAKIRVAGGMGLVFTVGTTAIFCLALPEARWFLALSIPVGALIGLILHTWHKRHPIT